MDKKSIDKINEFINERFVVSLIFSEYKKENVGLLVKRKDLDEIILRLGNYLKEHVNDLPENVFANGLSILNEIYFNYKDKCVNINSVLNEIKSLNNTKKRENFNDYFLFQEFDNYIYQKGGFINIKSVCYLNVKDVIALNAQMFSFIYNNIYLSDEDYYEKYNLLEGYGLDTQYMYMINYMINTCPDIFKLPIFNARIQAILKRNDYFLSEGKFIGAEEVMPKIKYMKKYNKNILKRYKKR